MLLGSRTAASPRRVLAADGVAFEAVAAFVLAGCATGGRPCAGVAPAAPFSRHLSSQQQGLVLPPPWHSLGRRWCAGGVSGA